MHKWMIMHKWVESRINGWSHAKRGGVMHNEVELCITVKSCING